MRKRALEEAQNPASEHYHHWLTPEEYAERFGSTPEEIAQVSEWLAAAGLHVEGASRTATRIAFHGTAALVAHAFQTELRHYVMAGRSHFAGTQAPVVPTDIAELVMGVRGLHDFYPEAPPHAVAPLYALPITGLDGGAAYYPIMGPADFASIYNLGGVYSTGISGSGQGIAVIGRSDFNDADIAAFRSTFGLPAAQPVRVLVPNTGPATVVGLDDFGEAELDLEWAGAIAPDATVNFVFTGGTQENVSEALDYAIEQRVASVVSLSYYSCEDWFTATDGSFEEGYGELAALEGISVVAAAGDTGAAGCDSQSSVAAQYGEAVLFPASLPTFVAVGGSQFQLSSTNQSSYLNAQLAALSYIPESGWNETLDDIDAGYGGLGAGGGGASRLFAKPSWQVPYTANDGARDLPDMALSASADTLPYAVSMSWTTADGDAQAPQPQALTAYGGTSVATPSFAGILALVNQAVDQANGGAQGGLGNPNPSLYALANSVASSDAFHDIITGDNIVPCQPGSVDCPTDPPYQFGYVAASGYDKVTGLGSVDVTKLVAAWSALSPTATTVQVVPSGAGEGEPMKLTANIASSALAHPIGGTVEFYFVGVADSGVGLSGLVGSAPVVARTTAGKQGGSAMMMAPAPGGLAGAGAKVAAAYSGDSNYLASWSALSSVGAASAFTICPGSATLAAKQSGLSFTTTGGSAPVRWGLSGDSTCERQDGAITCSSIDGGVFVAGPAPGTVTVVAVDQYNTYVTARVIVTDAGGDGGQPRVPVDSCSSGDAGDSDSSMNASTASDAEAVEAAVSDGSMDIADSTRGAGCGCTMTGAADQRSVVGWFALVGIVASSLRRCGRRSKRRRLPRCD
jgi:MYXO-CTERM domain-containing protein